MMATIISWDGKPIIGSMIDFGGHKWRVLDIKDRTALIISEQIIEHRPYHNDWADITWEICSLRGYLNGEYYINRFTTKEKDRIVEVRNSNPPNPWYGTDGGADTIDKIFLLSLDELVRYFGDSGDLKNKRRQDIVEGQYIFNKEKGINESVLNDAPNGPWLSDNFNQERIAKDADGKERIISYWLLRSPGKHLCTVARVLSDGKLFVSGLPVFEDDGGVRPAMWVKI